MKNNIVLSTKKLSQKKGPNGFSLLEGKSSFKLELPKRIKSQEITHIIRQLATLVQMRLPLDHSLKLVIEQTEKEKVKNLLTDCKHRLERGQTLANAFAAYPKCFNESVLKCVEIGELTGKLGDMFEQAAVLLEKSQQLKRKLLTALSYPIVVLVVATGAVGFLLTVVVPTFAQVFSDFGSELPAATKILVNTGTFLSNWWYLILGAIFLVALLLKKMWSKPKTRLVLENLIWKIPVFGAIVQKEKFSRFVRTLSMLTENGIVLTAALKTSGSSSTSIKIEYAIKNAQEKVERGISLYAALQSEKIFPVMMVQMIRVGEESSTLAIMLKKTAEYYEAEIDSAIETLNAVLEPIIIVGLGLVLGAILIALYMQIFSVVNVIQ
jgi:type IV pilus assembly protein PilC